MAETLTQRVVEALPFLDEIAEVVQPEVQKAVGAGGTKVRNVLDGTPLELPLHPALTDVPMGAWTAAITFDALDIVTSSKAMRNAADATLALGVAGGFAAAATGFSDWRYLSGGARRMGVAHALLNVVGLVSSVTSLVLRASGHRNAGRLAFLAGFSLSGTAAHLGGELAYNYGLRVNHDAFEPVGPEEFSPVLPESELPEGGVIGVSTENGANILLSRSSGGEVCAISGVCTHLGGPLAEGERQGDTVVCPLHSSRFDLCSGKVIDGPATFPLSRYETRVRDGNIEVKAAAENVQEKVR
jgi:nitrite reductase/ring-hydroxylating ferredoxin subunit/uncharacterized membrane protein